MKKIINIVKHTADIGNGIKLKYLEDITLNDYDISEAMLYRINSLEKINYIKVIDIVDNIPTPIVDTYIEEPVLSAETIIDNIPEVIEEPILEQEEKVEEDIEEPIKKQRGRPKKVEEESAKKEGNN